MSGDIPGKVVRAARKARPSVVRRRSKRTSGTSIYEVAQKAGVSIVTVSRVFNDYPHVSPAMREHVLKAARDIGYQPRLVAKRHLLGVLVGGLDDMAAGEQTSRLVLALMQAAAKRSYLIEFIPIEYAERATQHLADGLIALGLSGDQLARLRNLPPVPRVALNNQEVDESWHVVTLDPYAEVQMAVRHLVENGHRHITLVRSTARTWQEQQREAGFNAALNEAGLDGHHIVTCPYRVPSAELARKVQATACTACICLCHHGGLPVLDGLQNDLKVRIPEELSLITIENRRVSSYLNPRLTTIVQPLDQLAEETMDCLLQPTRARSQRSVSVLKSDLIVRDSVRRLGSPGR